MSPHPRVLVVAPTGGITRTLAPSLRAAGFEPDVVSDFASAKEALGTGPDLLITELKLGAFNGLHLAIRAGAQGTPTIIIGEPDPVLEAEARRQHARYLTSLANHDEIVGIVTELLSTVRHTRRSPRKQVPLLDAFVNDLPARLLDVSYEGLRLEAAEHTSGALPPHFTVHLPVFNFSCVVQRVWTAPLPSDDAAASGSISCGAELTMDKRGHRTYLADASRRNARPGLRCLAVGRRTFPAPSQIGPKHTEPLEREVTLVFAQDAHEPLVVVRRHVETGDEHLVVPARVFETQADEFTEIIARQIPCHEGFVDTRPEGLSPQ